MPRKKTTPAAKPDAILPDELLEKLIPGPMDAAGGDAHTRRITNPRGLQTEIDYLVSQVRHLIDLCA